MREGWGGRKKGREREDWVMDGGCEEGEGARRTQKGREKQEMKRQNDKERGGGGVRKGRAGDYKKQGGAPTHNVLYFWLCGGKNKSRTPRQN